MSDSESESQKKKINEVSDKSKPTQEISKPVLRSRRSWLSWDTAEITKELAPWPSRTNALEHDD